MRSLFTGLVSIVLFVALSHTAASQCSYYSGYCYAYYVEPMSVQQGDVFYIEASMYTYDYIGWPKATFPVEISTDQGKTWTTLLKDCNIDGPYDYYGDGYEYDATLYAKMIMPTTIPPGKHKVRVREQPASAKECTYTYPPDEDWMWMDIEVVRGCKDPVISKQPQSIAGCQGFNYSITAVGPVEKGYINYEWYKDGVLINKTVTPQLDFFPITTANAGTYYFRVVDVCGRSATSQKISVTVSTPAVITTEPVGKTVCEGQPYTMTVAANGSPLKYQWYKDGKPLLGKTSNSYLISSATGADQGQYFVIVTGGCGDPDTSNKVTIAVPTKPVFTTPLAGGLFCPGTSAVVAPDVTGAILAYQWYRGDTPIVGATSRNLTIDNISKADNGFYWVEVNVPGSELSGCPAITKSGRVFVGVHEAPKIMNQPESINLCEGGSTRLVVEADGTGLVYQWMKDGNPIPNSNNYSLALDNVTAATAGDYTVQITGACNFTTTSAVAEVHVYRQPTITAQPQSTSVRVGETITLSVQANDAQTVVWLHNESEVSRGASTTLTINNAQVSDAGYYRALIQNVCGGVTSRSALVGVIDPASLIPTIGIASTGLDAGSVPFGYWADKTFTALVVNAGSVDITINGYSFTGTNAADFAVQTPATPYTLAPGGTHEVVIRYTPSSVGASNAVLNVNSTATAGVNTVPIVGQGVLLYSVDQVVDFGTVDKAQATIKCFNVNNTSGTDIVIDAVSINGANSDEFRITSQLPMTITAGATTEICVEFTPVSVGNRSVQLAIMSSTGGNSSTTAIGTCEIASSVVEDGSLAGMSIYPNPASGTVTINIGTENATSLMIFDGQGAMVYSMQPSQSVVTWNLRSTSGSPVAAGTYNVLVTNEAGSYHMTLQVVR